MFNDEEKHQEVSTLMNIIPVVCNFMAEIFQTAELFLENPVSFSEMESRLTSIGNRSLAEIMGQILEEADTFIGTEPGRREKYTIQRHDPRTLVTTFGDVHFHHTLFRSREDGKYHYLLDERMHLPKDEHFSELAETKLLQEAAKTSYQHAADQLEVGMQKVSKVAVMTKVHSTLKDLPDEEVKEQKKCKYLYIEADEDHIHRQKGGEELRGDCIIGKLIYVFEGKEDLENGRRQLINPVYFGGQYAGSEENGMLWDKVQGYIQNHYDQSVLKRVYICSDGGAWIKAGAEHIDKSVLVADRFHLMKYINRLSRLTYDESDYTKGRFYKYIYKNKKAKVQRLLVDIRRSVENQEAVNAGETFLMNNWEAIQRAFHDKHVLGCSAEGHVSHLYSDRMSSRPMGWSETGADRMCRLRCLTKTYGDEKIVELVRLRREQACEALRATGTEGPIGDSVVIRKKYTEAQKEAAAYAERMHATLAGTLTRKELAIRSRLWI